MKSVKVFLVLELRNGLLSLEGMGLKLEFNTVLTVLNEKQLLENNKVIYFVLHPSKLTANVQLLKVCKIEKLK